MLGTSSFVLPSLWPQTAHHLCDKCSLTTTYSKNTSCLKIVRPLSFVFLMCDARPHNYGSRVHHCTMGNVLKVHVVGMECDLQSLRQCQGSIPPLRSHRCHCRRTCRSVAYDHTRYR